MSEKLFQIGVKALIENSKGQVLLMHQTENDLWDIPGGRVDEGETFLETLERELKEEIGVSNFEVTGQFLAVKARKGIPSVTGDLGLALVIYRVKLAHNLKLRAEEPGYEIYWDDKQTASKVLSDKYPLEFCDRLSKLDD